MTPRVEPVKSPAAAFLLSLIFPGLGQLYLGRAGQGAAVIIATLLLLPLLTLTLLPLGIDAFWGIPVWWLAVAGVSAWTAASMGRCPFCQGVIDREALSCSHCQRSLTQPQAQSAPATPRLVLPAAQLFHCPSCYKPFPRRDAVEEDGTLFCPICDVELEEAPNRP